MNYSRLCVVVGLLLCCTANAQSGMAYIGGVRVAGPGNFVDSNASFQIGVTIDSGMTFTSSVMTTNQVEIVGIHNPQEADTGKQGKLFFVQRINGAFYMLNASGNMVPWNGMVSSLVPYRENVRLDQNLQVEVATGQLAPSGEHKLYIGYAANDGALVFTPNPLVMQVDEPSGFSTPPSMLGKFAYFRTVAIPGATEDTPLPHPIHSTNDGIYMEVNNTIHKLMQGGPSAVWSSWTPANFLYHWEPVSDHYESAGVFSVLWASSKYEADKQKAGLYVKNNGNLPPLEWKIDKGFASDVEGYYADHSARGLDWAIDDFGTVFVQSAAQRGGADNLSFEEVVKLGQDVVAAIADDDDFGLYVITIDGKLAELRSQGITRTWDLNSAVPNSFPMVSHMQWADGKLWIGYSGHIVKFDGTTVSLFDTGLPPVFGTTAPTFCIAGSQLYSGGKRYSLNGGEGIPYLLNSGAVLDAMEKVALEYLAGTISQLPISCLQNTVSSPIYHFATEGVVKMAEYLATVTGTPDFSKMMSLMDMDTPVILVVNPL